MRLIWWAALLSFATYGAVAETDCPSSIQTLIERKAIQKPAKLVSKLDLFKNTATPYDIFGTFTDIFLSMSITDSNLFRIYQGSNCTAVMGEYQQDNRLFGLLKSVNSWRANHLYPFNDTVIGIDTKEAYSVNIITWKVNYIRVALFVGGILLFLFAGLLARNVIFYYTSGCSIGLLASILLVGFLVYRVAPKKTIGIPILVGGWSVSLYMLHFAWNNLSNIMSQYQKFVVGYFAAALLISFAVCYKRGPPTDARSHDIVQWMLQLVALVLIYVSSQVTEVSLAVIAILAAHQLTRSWLWGFLGTVFGVFTWMWHKISPPKRKFLTEEEYETQTRETTKLELQRLRAYCRSPDANAWKITHSVKNPKRLARFIDGTEEHISDDEQIEHDLLGEFLERDSDDGTLEVNNDDDEIEHEIIIRQRSRHGKTTPMNRSIASTSFLAPRGMTADEILQRISSSAAVPQQPKKSRLGRGRHSIGGTMLNIPAPAVRKHSSKNSTSSSTSSVRRSTAGRNPPKPAKDRSITHEYLSSDSEDQAHYEDDLIAQGGDFDFERD